MSLNLKRGQPIAKIDSGEYRGEIVYIDRDKKITDKKTFVDLGEANLVPLMNVNARSVEYIAGCSGSGKSTHAANLAKYWRKIFPDGKIYFFSCTDYRDDPAFAGIKMKQVTLDETLVSDPLRIEELRQGSLCIFDDVGTIINPKVKKECDTLIMKIMEIGRRKMLWLIFTNHLLNPAERLLGRTVMNEMHSFTFFPQSGSRKQIRYALDKYFELDKHQINKIFSLPSRYVTLSKQFPITVTHEHGVYLV